MNNPWILLLWGAPAAGKSTLTRAIANIYRSRSDETLAHLGTDNLNQAVLGNEFDPRLRSSLYESILTLADNLLRSGRPILIEGTFLDPRWRHRLQQLARHHGARLVSVQVDCRLALRERRNQQRANSERVPGGFLRMAHEKARNQVAQADFVFDTELLDPHGLARFLLGEIRRTRALKS